MFCAFILIEFFALQSKMPALFEIYSIMSLSICTWYLWSTWSSLISYYLEEEKTSPPPTSIEDDGVLKVFKLISLQNGLLVFFCIVWIIILRSVILSWRRSYRRERYQSLAVNFVRAANSRNYQEALSCLQMSYKTALAMENACNLNNTARKMVVLLYYWIERIRPRNEAECQQKFNNVISTFQLVTTNLKETRNMVIKNYANPIIRTDPNVIAFDELYDSIMLLMDLMIKAARTKKDITIVKEWTTRFVQQDHRAIKGNMTFLELCIWGPRPIGFEINLMQIGYLHNFQKTPSKIRVVRLILICGAKVNAKNAWGETILYVATLDATFNEKILEMLIQYGAHLDRIVDKKLCPIKHLLNRKEPIAALSSYRNLKCICARYICINKIPYKDKDIPIILKNFVELHEA